MQKIRYIDREGVDTLEVFNIAKISKQDGDILHTEADGSILYIEADGGALGEIIAAITLPCEESVDKAMDHLLHHDYIDLREYQQGRWRPFESGDIVVCVEDHTLTLRNGDEMRVYIDHVYKVELRGYLDEVFLKCELGSYNLTFPARCFTLAHGGVEVDTVPGVPHIIETDKE